MQSDFEPPKPKSVKPEPKDKKKKAKAKAKAKSTTKSTTKSAAVGREPRWTAKLEKSSGKDEWLGMPFLGDKVGRTMERGESPGKTDVESWKVSIRKGDNVRLINRLVDETFPESLVPASSAAADSTEYIPDSHLAQGVDYTWEPIPSFV